MSRCHAVKTLDHPCLILSLRVEEIPLVVRVGPEIVRLAQVVREDYVGRYTVFVRNGTVVANRQRCIVDGAAQRFPNATSCQRGQKWIIWSSYFTICTRLSLYLSYKAVWKY
jgi:hypothetical protein